jgi:hypothetical protein
LKGGKEIWGYVLVNTTTQVGFKYLRDSVDSQGLECCNVSRVKREELVCPRVLFTNSRILPFDKLTSLNRLLFLHSIAFNYAPQSFANIWQKNDARETGYNLRNDDFFILPLARIELFRKTPAYALPLAWNTLPDHIRYQHNRCTFKIALTDFLFENNPVN